jgi:Spy/CpxP family protein refolding chaperone
VHAVQFEAERKAMEARRAEHEKALVAILTPEQRAKHEALAKQRHGPMMRGRGPGGPADGPHGGHHGPGEEEGTTR